MDDTLLPNCRAPGGPFVPDLAVACDVAASCGWCMRNHLSFDFLCCESGTYIGPHMTNPLLLYLFWNNVPWTVLLVLAFELTETLLLTMLGSFELLFSSETDLETASASLIGDVLIQGGLGLFIGYLLRVVFLVPTLASSPQRADAFSPGCGRRAVYVVLLYGPMVASYALIGWTTASGLRIGLILQTVVHVLFIWLVVPLATASKRPLDDDMIWRRLDGSVYDGWRKWLFFAVWGGIVLASHAVHFARHQPTFAANEWFQQWLVVGPVAAALLVAALAVSVRRRDWYTVFVLLAAACAYGWLASWTAYSLGGHQATSLVWLGLAFFVAAIALFLAAARPWLRDGMLRDGTAVPGDTTTRLPAVALTRRAAETAVGRGKPAETEPMLAMPQAAAATVAGRQIRSRTGYRYNV